MSSVIIIYHSCCVVSVCLQSHYNLLWYGNKPLWALSDLCFVNRVSMSDLMSSSPNSTDFLFLWGVMAFTVFPINVADRGEPIDAPLDTASGEPGRARWNRNAQTSPRLQISRGCRGAAASLGIRVGADLTLWCRTGATFTLWCGHERAFTSSLWFLTFSNILCWLSQKTVNISISSSDQSNSLKTTIHISFQIFKRVSLRHTSIFPQGFVSHVQLLYFISFFLFPL